MAQVTVAINAAEAPRAVGALEAGFRMPRGVLKAIGITAVQHSREAFERQRLGALKWPPRYPNLAEPFINIAGALQDFNEGSSAPLPSRFERRPALINRGMRGGLMGSVKYRVLGNDGVEWYSDDPNADRMQRGGPVVQIITPGAKERIKQWLWKQDGTPRAGRAGYVRHLNQLLHKNTHRTNVAARPFIGMTPALEKDIERIVAAWVKSLSQRRRG